ncbi:TPA: hypothetical protein TUC26_000820, partial [Streptococcus equi subsp. zooepidemicus]|nr:hypothetical protein [Streptococcus equi subsp. zooepidemicus]HEL0172606.1 hypothetical protein [Streptococcus equi subsp. zooepidemicus]
MTALEKIRAAIHQKEEELEELQEHYHQERLQMAAAHDELRGNYNQLQELYASTYQAVSSYLRHYDASLITDQYTVLTRLIDDYQHRTEQCYHEQCRKMSQQEEAIDH